MIHEEFILHRYEGNPILTPADFPGAEAVFNCGQIMQGRETVLLVAVIHRSGMYRGVRGATTHVARSVNGISFTINPDPFIQRPAEGLRAEFDHHPIDTRITEVEGEYYIVHPACGEWGTFGLLGKTRDFTEYEFVEVISLPDNRVPCLFPQKIGGAYWRLDRPYRVVPNEHHEFGNIWACSSPDMIHWGRYRPVLKAGFAPWAQTKIGPVPPILTDAGWLTIIHGVSQSCAGYRYSLGAVLFDRDDPTKVIGQTMSPILAPYASYEQAGCVPNVVFSCGAIPDNGSGRIRIYYGAADTCIGLAEGSVDELVSACVDYM